MSLDTPKTNIFTEYEMTQEEQQNGQIYSSNQLAVLKNLRALTAQQRLALAYDPIKHDEFIQNEAFLKGQLAILEVLISTHEETLAELAP